MSTTGTLPDALARGRAAVEPALRDAVSSLAPELRLPAGYHLGWTDASGRPTTGGGKGIRQALALLSAEAAGAPAAAGVPGGVAVELIHNFSLLHDDIIDGDTERRHRPTVWTVYGTGTAVITGDALMALALQILLEAGPLGAAAALELTRATTVMIDGQASDMAFEHRLDVSFADSLSMAEHKTGALLSCAASIGAILAGAPDSTVDALRAYGRHLGLAFQAVDDLLGIWGDPDRTGKPRWSDLATGKKSLPIAAALGASGRAPAELRRLISRRDLDERELARAAQLVDAAGGRRLTEQLIGESLEQALTAVSIPELAPATVDELRELAHFISEREF